MEVRKIGTDEVIKRMGPLGEREAEKVERGVSINMNREEYYTEIIEDEDDE